jgi:pimeloyl-ACP methyl ester carboxylesterase
MNRLFQTAFLMTLASWATIVTPIVAQEPSGPSRPTNSAERDRFAARYEHGTLERLTVEGRDAYLIRPKGPIDSARRWVWIAPFWLGIDNGQGRVEHRFYVERFLAKGFHVAGIDVGTSCGSPASAKVNQAFYERLTSNFSLNRKARLIGQSNGGLIAYAWAFRHPDSVDRIFGIYPATDFRTWPGLEKVISFPPSGLGYDLTLPELTRRAAEFNPIDNLAPLAKARVKILHIHGDMDLVVPAGPNSETFVERYNALGGRARLISVPGVGHQAVKAFYECQAAAEFLLAD